MAKDNKKFRLMDWAKKNAPKALNLAGDITGIDALNNLAGIIKGKNPDNLSPEQIAHALEVRKLDIQEIELYLADVANARQREIELARAGKRDVMMLVVGSTILTLMAFAVVAVFLIDLKNDKLAYMVLGELMTLGGMMAGYYFGSSKSSADKTRLLSNDNNSKSR